MAFHARFTIETPERGEAPAFLRVCGQAILSRLVLGAHRGGARTIAIVGDDEARARRLLLEDDRTRALDLRFGEDLPDDLPHVLATADIAVSTPVWKLLDAADAPARVPGAPLLEKRGANDAREAAPLWTAEPPAGCWVEPVRDRDGLREAKRRIFENITKTTSGPVSRHLNSKLSIPISKVLVETPMTPNQMTLVNTVLGILGAAFCALGSLGGLALGAAFLQLTSALDRNDGELARAKMMESEKGAWMDTVGDNVTYVAYVLGLAIGYARFAQAERVPWAPYTLTMGLGVLAVTAGLIGFLAWYVHKQKLGGTMTAISHHFRANVGDAEKGFAFRILDKLKVLGERDQFSLGLGVLGVLPWLLRRPSLYHALAGATLGFILLACVYFLAGAVKAGRRYGGVERGA